MSDPNKYTVAWICAIETEYLVAQLCLDEEHPRLRRRPSPQDTNTYTLGKVAEHNVVIASLPDGSYGTSSAAVVATNLLRSFPNIRIGLMVGIGGGAPSPPHRDIRLGDIVVSSPADGKGGVLQYDFGKTIQEQGFQGTKFLNQPPAALRTAVVDLKVEHKRRPGSLENAINSILEKEEEDLREELTRPDASSDKLYRSDLVHPPMKQGCAEACGSDPSALISRPERTKRPHAPVVHYGLIASGNQLMKDALRRDELASKEKVLCFEMEAAGLMNDFPCLVVRGICDYSDTHKNDRWQGYAALAAATYAKDLLKRVPPEDVEAEKRIGEILSGISKDVEDVRKVVAEGRTAQREMREDDKYNECLGHLRLTDPRDDKKRIEKTKGGLLKDSYRWVLESPEFQTWSEDDHSRLLWVKGDPGKGKTMLLCGVIDELEKSTSGSGYLSYFFCQGADSRINSATAVLRGLIYLLVDQEPSLISHIQKKYNTAGKQLFDDTNTWWALFEIFTGIVDDLSLQTYLVIDALDECIKDSELLLDFIIQISSTAPRVKWIISSRNWPEIEKRLDTAEDMVKLCLELNAESVSATVGKYIQHEVDRLASLQKYSDKIRDAVRDYLALNAVDTFLWVALVCQDLAKVPRWKVLARLNAFPPGLDCLYQQMVDRICDLPLDDAELCKRILACVATVYRPITLTELVGFVNSLEDLSEDPESLFEIIGLCGSFLTIRDNVVYFVHQSAKDFLVTKVASKIFRLGIRDEHHNIFSRSLQVMSEVLKRNIYNLASPGFPISQVEPPDPDPLAAARYACIYWIDHLTYLNTNETKEYSEDLQDGGAIDTFLRTKYLYWLEALSLLNGMPEGVLAIVRLEDLLQQRANATVKDLARDACRFILYHNATIENSPLQVYSSALIFSPAGSVIREMFKQEEPEWITTKPVMEDDWSACLQTLEDHINSVKFVTFNPHGKQVASASYGYLVISDASSGSCLWTLEGDVSVKSVAFSPDGKRVLAAFESDIEILDSSNGSCLQTLEGHTGQVESVAFSLDGKQIASVSSDYAIKIIKVWDASSGSCLRTHTLEYNLRSFKSVAFLPDGEPVVLVLCHSGVGNSYTFEIWSASTGRCLRKFEGHDNWVTSVAISLDGKRVASASEDHTVKIWDTSSGDCLQTLKGSCGRVYLVAFSSDGKQVVSVADALKIWDASGGSCLHTFKGHRSVESIAFSPDSKRVALGTFSGSVEIWDITGSGYPQTPKGHTDMVYSVAFSQDSKRAASASSDHTVKIWDTSNGSCLQTLDGHTNEVKSAVFSPDGKQVASASKDCTIKIWETASSSCLQTLKGHTDQVSSIAFSPDGKQVVSVSHDCTVRIWDASSGYCQYTLRGHGSLVTSVAFSPDGKQIASAAYDSTVKIWDPNSGSCLRTLKAQSEAVLSVAFSSDSRQVASELDNRTVEVWDVSSGSSVQTLEGYGSWVNKTCFDTALHESQRQLCDFGPDGWITWNGENVLRLPLEFQPHNFVIAAQALCIGCRTGRVLIIKFSFDKSPLS